MLLLLDGVVEPTISDPFGSGSGGRIGEALAVESAMRISDWGRAEYEMEG